MEGGMIEAVAAVAIVGIVGTGLAALPWSATAMAQSTRAFASVWRRLARVGRASVPALVRPATVS
jgi:hypothetical protein